LSAKGGRSAGVPRFRGQVVKPHANVATSINGFYWVYYGALSNVEYAITVTDIVTGATSTYQNPGGRFASAGDTEAS
jgi:hypothetical protein